MRDLVRRALVIALLLSSTGCGVLIQTAMGWSSERTERKTQHHSISVTTNPPNAQVFRARPPAKEETLVGNAPLTDSVEYTVEHTIESPKVLGLVIGGLIDLAGGIALASQGSSDNPALYILGAYAIALGGFPELLAAVIYGLSGDTIADRKTVEETRSVYYTARLAGYPDTFASLRIPDQGKADLVLGAGAIGDVVAQQPEPQPPPAPEPAAPAAKTWVIAVMDVEDVNADRKEQAIDAGLLRNLGDQLRIFIAQQGARTIDRGAQDKVLKEQISTMKQESFKACYDDSCQLELGKALAASHILRARITRFGQRCVLNTEMIDLVAEVTVAASSAQGDCGAEGFLTMSDQVAKKLFAR